MFARTDLALERLDAAAMPPVRGAFQENYRLHGIEITRVTIRDAEASKRLHKEIGVYYTMESPPWNAPDAPFAAAVETAAELIRSLCPPQRDRCVLVVGLGNRDITPDALGPRVIGQILATRHLQHGITALSGSVHLYPVAALAVGVLGQTGMETSELVKSAVECVRPAAVIAVDALAAAHLSHLARTLQIANTGIHPGSGVQNRRKALSAQTLGVPVLSIGVPLVVDLASVTGERRSAAEGMMVTPREIDLAVEHAARTIAFAINRALQPELSLEELTGLLG